MSLSKNAKKPIVKVLIVVVVAQSICLVKVYRKWSYTHADLDEMRVTAKIERFVNGLRIPSEALYYDRDAAKEIDDIRRKALLALGVDKFLPYGNVSFAHPFLPDGAILELGKSGGTSFGLAGTPDYSIYCPVEPDGWYLNEVEFFERKWLRQVENVLGMLEGALRTDSDIRRYLDANPGYFERIFQPWLERLTRCTRPDVALPACRILLSQGQKTEAVRTALAKMIHGRYYCLLGTSFGYEERAMALVKEYDMDILTDPNAADGG